MMMKCDKFSVRKHIAASFWVYAGMIQNLVWDDKAVSARIASEVTNADALYLLPNCQPLR